MEKKLSLKRFNFTLNFTDSLSMANYLLLVFSAVWFILTFRTILCFFNRLIYNLLRLTYSHTELPDNLLNHFPHINSNHLRVLVSHIFETLSTIQTSIFILLRHKLLDKLLSDHFILLLIFVELSNNVLMN